MKNLLKLFLMSFIITIPTMAWSTDLYVSGRITNTDNEPITGATIMVPNTPQGTTSDINGEFKYTFRNVDDPANVKLKISYLGYQTQDITPGTDQNIILVENLIPVDDAVVTVCGSRPAEGRKTQALKDPEKPDQGCYPTACYDEFTLNGTGIDALCVARNCHENNGSGKYAYDENTKGFYCKLDKCDSNKYELVNNICKKIPTNCSDKQLKEHQNATKTDLDSARNCIALDCQCGYDVQGGKCVAWPTDANEKYKKPCDDNQLKKLNAKSGIVYCENDTAKCEITACISDDYTHNTQNNTCDNKNKQPCTHGDKNATDAEYKQIDGKLTCVINDCRAGYTPNSDGTACTPQRVLSESDSQAKINELKDNAQKMKDKEQSTANALLGAAGIGATGIGGMQMASAMAEENADADAEAAMRAYLATFHCNYGAGKNIPGGERDVELPGGNELIGLYSEYVNLANDLKVRKTALDMRPGIESEPILDAATSGLYDDVAIGKTSGAYTSLARALMDPNGPDAAAWAAQKAETADKKKTGMITAGIGAVGSLVGNLAINSGKAKQEKSAEIIAKYEKLKQVFQTAQAEFDALPARQCSEFTNTTNQGTVPNCECVDKINTRFSLENGGCIPCGNDKVYNENNECVCPGNKPRFEDGQCKELLPNCPLKGDLVIPNECECVDNATADKDVCKCNTGYIQQDNACAKQDTTPAVPPIQEEIKESINLNANSDTLFVSGKADLSEPEGKKALKEFIQEIKKYNLNDGNFCIAITGHTDRVPFKTAAKKGNQKLSQERADKIKQELIYNANIAEQHITTFGKGEAECTEDLYPMADSPGCRRVDIVLKPGKCQS